MKSCILTVPCKKTEEVNWIKPLNNYLISVYGNTSEYQDDLNSLEKLRQDLRGANADMTGIRMYYRYFSALELLDLRIPFLVVNKHKAVKFTWYDSFEPSVVHKQTALPFEKAGVLFNLGALLSSYASSKYDESLLGSTSQSTDESFKNALQYLQQSAGVYQFLNENFLHAPSDDLNSSTIKFLVKLMLGQAQEVFLLKVISGDTEQKKNSLIAKLSESASVYFSDCYKMVGHLLNANNKVRTSSSDFSVVEADEFEDEGGDFENEYNPEFDAPEQTLANISVVWIAVVKFKSELYNSLAKYYHGLSLESSRKYGESIAYFTKALNILNDIPSQTLKTIAKTESNQFYEMLDSFKGQKNIIEIKLADLNKDNDLIYHDIVPPLVSLPEIKAMDAVKVIPINSSELFNEINEYNYKNFLTNVVPINIHELMSYYSEEKSQLLRNEIDMVEVSNEELSSVLEYLKLPKALVNIKETVLSNKVANIDSVSSDDSIDKQVLEITTDIAQNFQNDSRNKEEIMKYKSQLRELTNDCERNLLGKSSEGFLNLKTDLVRLKKSQIDASASDERLFNLINSNNSSFYNRLVRGINSREFKSLFEVDGSSPTDTRQPENEISLLDIDDSQLEKTRNKKNSLEDKISLVEDLLNDLNIIKSNKLKLIESLKKEIHADDISDILILNSKIKSTNEIKSVIFSEELKKFKPYSKELDRLVEKQGVAVDDLKKKWQDLSHDPQVVKIQSSKKYRDELVSYQNAKIQEFYHNNWKKYHSGLDAGVAFYKKLVDYTVQLKNTISSEVSRSTHNLMEQAFTGLSFNDRPQVSALQSYRLSLSSGGDQFHQNPTGHGQSWASSLPHATSNTWSERSTPLYTPDTPQNYTRPAPALPPKRPSQHHTTTPLSALVPPQNPAQTRSSHNTSEDLIYNQPSKYQPDMYNFFSKN